MDVSRAVLDNLMGRDRNKPMDKITERDHYSNPDVCKSFLVCFCFNTLFPNTTYDEGPCEKRHDTYLKTMFDSDPNRAQYEREYIRECIHWIERRLQEVEKKTKQNQSVIDNKSNFPADRPKQVLDRILAIEEEIEKLILDSQKHGQEGKIDESARCLEEVERLRDRRKEIELMGVDANSAQKQQKICLICGAIQTINDTEKRIQTHLEGKIHQGFLKLRHEVENLKIRLEVLNKMNPPEKKEREEHDKRREEKEKEREREKEREKERERERENDRRREENEKKAKEVIAENNEKQSENRQVNDREPRERSDSANRRRRRSRSRERREGDKDRERRRDSRDRRSRSRDRKERKHHRDSRERERENKEKSHRDKDHKKKHKKDRSRSKERENREVY